MKLWRKIFKYISLCAVTPALFLCVMEIYAPGYSLRLILSLDQFVNTVFIGDEDETISSRLGRAQENGNPVAKIACGFLDIFDKDHCEKSIEVNIND